VPDLVVVRHNSSSGNDDEGAYRSMPSNVSWNIMPCTIDAMWIPTDTWLDPSLDDTIYETESNPLRLRGGFDKSHDNIILSRAWLDMLNVQTSTNQTTFLPILNFYLGNTQALPLVPQIPAGTVRCLEAAISLFITDGLARLQTNIGQLWIDDPSSEAPALFFPNIMLPDVIDHRNSTAEYIASDFRKLEQQVPFFAFEVYKYGYGYGIDGSTGIIIAITFLSTYLVVAVIHVIIVSTGRWSSNTWTSPQGLIALAINSSPTEVLQNTCAGIRESKVWGRIVAVRKTRESHLGIVFDDGRMAKRIVPGKRYGTL
jgi:hypothetical protein